jgi:plastocyanin domain-containing protein
LLFSIGHCHFSFYICIAHRKMAIALAGLSLIGAKLWWFLGSKPKSQKAEISEDVHEVTITVDGGYVPSLVTVKRGQPVRLQFAPRS